MDDTRRTLRGKIAKLGAVGEGFAKGFKETERSKKSK